MPKIAVDEPASDPQKAEHVEGQPSKIELLPEVAERGKEQEAGDDSPCLITAETRYDED